LALKVLFLANDRTDLHQNFFQGLRELVHYNLHGKAMHSAFKRHSTDITHSLQCVLEFQSDHAQWRSKWEHVPRSAGASLGGASTQYIQTFTDWFD